MQTLTGKMMNDLFPADKSSGRRLAFFFLAAVIVTVMLRAPFYIKRQVFNPDEGTLAAIAQTILDGGVPYRDSWDTRGPVTYYIYAAVFRLFGRNNMLAVHFLLIVFVSVSSLMIMLVGRQMIRGPTGDLAGLVYALVSFSYLKMDMLAANVELFMVAFILAGMLLFVRGLKSGKRFTFLFSGLFLGIAFLTKQPAILDFAGLAFYLLFLTGPVGFSLKKRLYSAAHMSMGFLLPLGIVLSAFSAAGALRDFVFGFWTYSSKYFMPAMPSDDRFRMMYQGPLLLIQGNRYAWVTAIAGAVLLLLMTARRRGEGTFWPLPVIWGATSFLAASMSGRAFGHYYIQLLPPLSILSALFSARFLPRILAGIGRAWAYFLKGAGGRSPDRPRLFSPALLAGMIALAGYGSPMMRYYNSGLTGNLARLPAVIGMTVEERNARGLGRSMKELVDHLQMETSKEDSIFVWGFYPQIYLLTNRRPASRFSYCIYLTGLVPWVNVHPRKDTSRYIVPGSWDLLMQDLFENAPRYIVDTAPGNIYFWKKYPMSKYPRLKNFVDEHYYLDLIIRNRKGEDLYHLYRRGPV